MAKKTQTYTEAYTELEQILSELESADLDIDTLSEKVQRATELIGICRDKLKKVDADIQKTMDEISL